MIGKERLEGRPRPRVSEQERGQRDGCGLRFGAGDGDDGELVGASAFLHEVHEPLLEGGKCRLTELGELAALRLR